MEKSTEDKIGSVTMLEIQLESGDSVYGSCINYIGNIMTCLEEGVLDLPEPGLAFKAIFYFA